MPVSSVVRRRAITALCRHDGYPKVEEMFRDGTLGRKFAIDEIRRSASVFERHFMVEQLSKAANIGPDEVNGIVRKLCLGLIRSAEFKLNACKAAEVAQRDGDGTLAGQRKKSREAQKLCEAVEGIIFKYKFWEDRELVEKYSYVAMRSEEYVKYPSELD